MKQDSGVYYAAFYKSYMDDSEFRVSDVDFYLIDLKGNRLYILNTNT